MEKFTTKILEHLRSNQSFEYWKPLSKDETFFGEFLCKKTLRTIDSDFKFEELSLLSFHRTLLEYSESLLQQLDQSLSQYSVFILTNLWARAVLENLIPRIQNIEIDYYDSFTSNQLIQEVQNGEWVSEQDQILFNKNFVRSLAIEEYSVNFINSSIKSITRNNNQFIVHTYANTDIEVVITTPAKGKYEIVCSLGKHVFAKQLRLTIRKTDHFVIRSNEALYEHVFEIKDMIEYIDGDNDGIKYVVFQPIKVKENKSEAIIFLEGQNSDDAVIKYRTFNNGWTDYQSYESKISLYEKSLVEMTSQILPVMNSPDAATLDLDLSSYFDTDFLFDPSEVTLLREVDSPESWTIDTITTVNIYSKEFITLDFGNLKLLIDNKEVSGVTKISPGFHEVKIDNAYIYPLVENAEDVYYPNNLYHLFSGGFGYPKLFTTFKARSKQAPITEVFYSKEKQYTHSLVNDQGVLRAFCSATPSRLYREQTMLILTKRVGSQPTHLQLRLEMPRTFIGSFDAIGVSFK